MTRRRREAAAAASCSALGFVSNSGLAALARRAAVPDLAGRAAGLDVANGSSAGSVWHPRRYRRRILAGTDRGGESSDDGGRSGADSWPRPGYDTDRQPGTRCRVPVAATAWRHLALDSTEDPT